MTGRSPDGELDWLLAEFARATPGVVHALVVSSDGLRVAATPEVGSVLADQMSAAMAGLISLARGAATLLGAGPVNQTIVDMDGGFVFATAMSEGSLLAVHATRTADMALVGYEMTMLSARVGHALDPGDRRDRAGLR